MDQIELQIQVLVDDFNAFEAEVKRELSGEGWTQLPRIMEENGYWDQIQSIQEQLTRLVVLINEKLENIQILFGQNGIEKYSDEERKSKIEELTNLKSLLTAVWGRLQSLISMIEQRQVNAQGVVSQTVHAIKNWALAIATWIKRISAQLWQLLSRLMTPKEWKIKGDVGTGVLGLANVGIEITFG